uniref:B30.2/SPRY domain-containing protein n=1 Tax=Xenopus tropicalis TaxID=8364 RepID=A0A6I8QLX3_XENTR
MHHQKRKVFGDIMSSQAARGLYGQEASDLLLDEHTASNDIALSGDMKSATCSLINLHRPESTARFAHYQVLSTESFTSGRHYWVFRCSRDRYWRVGVTYPSVQRMGYESWVGNNNKSWCLRRFNHKLTALHAPEEKVLLPSSPSQRFGVHLDYEAGRLSFYQLDNPVSHLHTFRATFTEPLHVACWVWWGGWITIRS